MQATGLAHVKHQTKLARVADDHARTVITPPTHRRLGLSYELQATPSAGRTR